MLQCKHRCHCAYSAEIGTCIINDAGRQAAQNNKTNNENTSFLVESRHTTFYTHVLKVNINIQHNKKAFNKITKLNDIIALTYKNKTNKSMLLVYLQEYNFCTWQSTFVYTVSVLFNLTSIIMYNTPYVDILPYIWT